MYTKSSGGLDPGPLVGDITNSDLAWLLTCTSVEYTRNGGQQVDYRGSYTHPGPFNLKIPTTHLVALSIMWSFITNAAWGRSTCDEAKKVILVVKVFLEECAMLDNMGPLHQQAAGGVYAAVCHWQ